MQNQPKTRKPDQPLALSSSDVLGPNAPRFACTWCSQCGASLGPGDSGVSHCTDHMEKQNMSNDIKPRREADIPSPERVSAVTVGGCEFVVWWGAELADYEQHHYLGIVGRQHPTAWVECVKLGGKWWGAGDVFSSNFCDQLDAALLALEDFSVCEP